jgi:hypothetical protein
MPFTDSPVGRSLRRYLPSPRATKATADIPFNRQPAGERSGAGARVEPFSLAERCDTQEGAGARPCDRS